MKTKNREKLDRKLLRRAEDANNQMWTVSRRLTIANADFSRELEALPKAFGNLDELERVFERLHAVQDRQAALVAESNRLRAAAALTLKKTDKRARQRGFEPLSLDVGEETWPT